MLSVVTYWWGDKYGHPHVEKLRNGFRRFMQQDHRLICVTDRVRRPIPGVEFIAMPPEDLKWTLIQGCLARMRLFDPDWQKQHQMDDRIMSVDLDVVAVNSLDSLADQPGQFRILQDINTTNPCPYNGSLFMLRPGYAAEVWRDLNEETVKAAPKHVFPDDQGWLWHKLPWALAYGKNEGVFGFKKKHWPDGDGLPLGAKLVCFPGWRDPQKFVGKVPWIEKFWR